MSVISFHITYLTNNNEKLQLKGKTSSGRTIAIDMLSDDGTKWFCRIEFDEKETFFNYQYCIVDNSQVIRDEAELRKLDLQYYIEQVYDAWMEHEIPKHYYSTAFSKCIFQVDAHHSHELFTAAKYLLVLRAMPPGQGFRWAIVGSSDFLHNWDIAHPMYLQQLSTVEWGIDLSGETFNSVVSYKYVLINEDSHEAIWEEGENRILPYPAVGKTFVHDEQPRMADFRPWKGAGLVIPVFSLRSRKSFGIGDFGDLKQMIRWCASVKFHAIQILPINDTIRTGTWKDSYPYSGIDIYALHPIYADLSKWSGKSFYDKYKEESRQYNEASTVAFEEVLQLKMAFLWEVFVQDREKISALPAYCHFVRENQEWLSAYSRFCVQRDVKMKKFKFNQEVTDEKLKQGFYSFVQYVLYEQIKEVREEARKLQVIIKGDLPIGVSRDSVPAATHPNLFHFESSAGAPPDDFSPIGQNWGFPTYDWERMQEDGYAWWKSRITNMASFLDAFRIDHVLGFFRIWEIPTNQIYGTLGKFRPALPFSEAEIKRYGFDEEVDSFTQPHLSDREIEALKAQYGEAVIHGVFQKTADGYVFKEAFHSQKHIEKEIENTSLRNYLLEKLTDVLFIPDDTLNGYYHPRILGYETKTFQRIDKYLQEAFIALYNDFFYKRHESFWAQEGKKKLSVIVSGNDSMLACAEDLGMVPKCVPEVLSTLDVATLEIQTMPKVYGWLFGDTSTYPYLSVATIATHDMPPLRLWWKQNTQKRQMYWENILHRTGVAPEEIPEDACKAIITQHLKSPAFLCLIAFQDWTSMSKSLRNPHFEEEQINNPANPNQNWNYRMHLYIEDLADSVEFNHTIQEMLKESSRI